jgi:enterochelin esterase-like enzyme
MRYLFLPTAIIFFHSFLYAQEIKITFMVKSVVNDSSLVYITGNDPKLGNWNPALVKLNKQSNDLWKIDLSFPKGTMLEYKYTLGGYEVEALSDKGMVPGNSHLIVLNDTVVYTEVKNWENDSAKTNSIKGQITGEVKYHRNFKGQGLLPRDIIVWLPPSYEKEKQKRYPVLYAHDGQNLFNPSTSLFKVDWQLDETADSLIKQGKIKEIIIVGIYNTRNREKEYNTGNTGKIYLKFIVNELKPFIDKNYRTLPDPTNTATIGSSAGALSAFMLVWEYNNVFSKAACLSPAFFIDKIDLITPVLNAKGKKKLKIYIDCGGTGLDSLLLTGAEKMISALNKKGYKDYLWYYDKSGEHNETNWAKRVWRPLQFFFNKY